MKITILNKNELKQYIPEKDAFLIRMSSQLPFSKINKEYYKNIYYYGFEDIDCFDYAMSNEEGLNLLKNLFENIKEKEVVISCDYAQGRSPAIALSFSRIIFGIDKNKIQQNYKDYNRYITNKLDNLYQTMINKLNSNKEEDILEYLKSLNLKGEINEN